MTSISTLSNFNVLLCIFAIWKKYMQQFLDLEIPNSFVVAYCYILFMHCWTYHPAVRMNFDLEVIQNSSASISGFSLLVVLLSFTLKRVGDCILPCKEPFSWFEKSKRIDPFQTLNFLFEIDFSVKLYNQPFCPMLCSSFIMPYF